MINIVKAGVFFSVKYYGISVYSNGGTSTCNIQSCLILHYHSVNLNVYTGRPTNTIIQF